jgi:CheY-like chemotaxis protein/HPt (histidine-containing phosphotransfer) domain-containing protein
MINFAVKDTVIGIREDKINTIFERFEQAGNEITRKFGGTGLGLSISKNLVELHGGKLEVISVYGEGSNFYFTIPFDKISKINDDENEEIAKIKRLNSDLAVGSLKKLRVLICEDNTVNVKLITHLFKNKVTHLEIAENGKVAIDILKRKMFDVILMDIHMPVMDGIEATKYIRKTMKLNLPIIGFTANSSITEKEICLKAGMNDCVAKNFVSHEIYEKMSKVVSKSKSYQEDHLSQDENFKVKFFYKRQITSKNFTNNVKYNSSMNLSKYVDKNNDIFFQLCDNYSGFDKHLNEETKMNKKKESFKRSLHLNPSSNNFKKINFSSLNNSDNTSRSSIMEEQGINPINITPFGLAKNRHSTKNFNFKQPRIFNLKDNDYQEDNFRFDTKAWSKNTSETKPEDNSPYIEIVNNKMTSSSDDESQQSECEGNIVQMNVLKEFTSDDESIEKQIIELFLTNFPLEIDSLKNEINMENSKGVKFWVHKMKTPLEMFGLQRLRDKFEKIETFCEEGKYIKALENLEKMKNKLNNIYEEFNRILN